jgi:adenylate cyclase
MLRKLLAGIGLGTVAAVIVLAIGATFAFASRLELATYDQRMQYAADPASVNKNIVLVKIDDYSIRDMAPTFGRWPWPRLALSFGIDFLKRGPAKVVAVDLILSERDKVVESYVFDAGTPGEQHWSAQQSERALADSLKAAGNVILLADAVYEGSVDRQADKDIANWQGSPFHAGALALPRPLVLPPYQALTDASPSLAHNFLVPDDDGQARRMAPFIVNTGRELPSLGVAAALRAGDFKPEDVGPDGQVLRIGNRRVPLVDRAMLINYKAPAVIRNAAGDLESPYPSYAFQQIYWAEQDILEGKKPRLDPAIFKDKIVFVGLAASGLVDVFGTPLSSDQSGKMPGIQLHATMADSILANRFIRPAPDRSRLLAVVITALAIGLLAAFLPFSAAAIASMAIVGGWAAYTFIAFKAGLWLNLVQPVASGGLALFFGTAYQYFVEGREKRKVARLFGRYVSKDVYAHLMSHPELAELGGKRRDMTVLFSDIRGFTSVTERGDPEELVAQLNEYFTRMVAIVFKHQGTVDKFVGDMVMALFSAPLDDVDHAQHAVEAAIEMVHELGALNRDWVARGMAQLDIGVGINSGDMIAGNIGSSAIMSYTVIGDNVNLGSRLESLNKEYKTRIIISDATRGRLKGDFEIRPLGDVIVKGKSKAVQIFEVKVPAPLVEVQTT